jgi:hypothetical protein
MIRFLTALLLLSSAPALAQLSVQDSDGSLKFKLAGKEFNTSFFDIASVETDKFNDDGGRLSTYSYLTLATYLNYDYRLAFRLPFQYNTAGTSRFDGSTPQNADLFLQDVIIGLQNYNLLYLPWDLALYWEGRMYLPTSENSQKAGTITRLRNNFILTKYLNQTFQVELDQKLNYYWQSQTTYKNHFVDEEGFDVNVVSGTKRSEFEHNLRMWGKIGPQSAIGWTIGTEDTYWNKSKAEGKAKPGERLLKTGPQIRFPLSNSANFIFTYEDKVDRDDRANRAEFGKFLAKNTQFTLLSFLSF